MEKLKKILTETPDETQKETPKDGKTNIYNLIILDQSGSMESIKREAINGYNETLQTIQSAQRKYAETQNHFVTLVVFNGEATNVIFNRIACKKAAKLTPNAYKPDSNTPLYDAMGTTLTNTRHTLDATTDNRVLATIITDGQENASREYTGQQIHQMVNELKALGWVFTYIGADHDVEEAAKKIGVANVLRFDKSTIGTKKMFAKERMSRDRYYDAVAEKRAFLEGKFFDDEDSIENAEK